MTTYFEKEIGLNFDKQFFKEQVNRYSPEIIDKFDRIIKNYVYFHLIFAVIAFIEILTLGVFFALMQKSTILAFSLAVIFLTIFSFFVIRLYFQAKKPEQFYELRAEFLEACKKIIRYNDAVSEHHISLAHAACNLAAELHEKEYTYYPPPPGLKQFASFLEKFSCLCHWKDLYKMKELLLFASIEEHIKVVKVEPINLEVHAALANAYVMLSSLYADPRKFEGYSEERYIPAERLSLEMQERFRAIAERAIEEFKILNDYAPNDPWVHTQLAYSYHDLQMPEEEIQEYETILKLNPDDKETHFKLGMLYFQQGRNAQGLRIYQELKQKNYKKAENLIEFYGSYSIPE